MGEVRRHLRLCLADGIAHSLMVGAGETYLPAFALALGMSDVVAGLVATIPMLAGGLVQLVAPAGIARVGSYRRWVATCAGLQAASFIPLLVAAALGRAPTVLVFLCASLYWATGMAAGSGWNVWVSRLIPARARSRYFGFRQAAVQAGVLTGLVGGGLWLHHAAGTSSQHASAAFVMLFALALGCRTVSTGLLCAHGDVPAARSSSQTPSLQAWLTGVRRDGQGRLILFMAAANAAAFMGSAFFTPYLLDHLHYSYWSYTVLVAASFAGKVLALPYFGRLVRRTGPRWLLVAGAVGVVPLPVLWLVSDGIVYLFALQLIGGAVWAAFELGVLLLFFDVQDERERTSLLASYNALNALAVASGAVAGGALLHAGGPAGAYPTLFIASTGLRCLTLILVVRVPDRPWRMAIPALRILGVRAATGAVARPILATMTPQQPESDGAPAPPELAADERMQGPEDPGRPDQPDRPGRPDP